MYVAFFKKQSFCSHLFISDFIHKDLWTLINYLVPSLLRRKIYIRTANLFRANFFCGVIPYLLVHLTIQFLKKKMFFEHFLSLQNSDATDNRVWIPGWLLTNRVTHQPRESGQVTWLLRDAVSLVVKMVITRGKFVVKIKKGGKSAYYLTDAQERFIITRCPGEHNGV